MIGAGLTASSWNKVLGANNRVLLGVIGPGSRGQSVLQHFLKNSDVEVVALCEIYDENLKKTQTLLPKAAKEFADYQKLLALPEVDAVLIATPDHWHAAMSIDAGNAGKDVYVEKPLTYTIDEGKAIIRAARLNDRVFQVGMQQRAAHT
jgi:predicted dehydrogenase